jgi:hypothetical protein
MERLVVAFIKLMVEVYVAIFVGFVGVTIELVKFIGGLLQRARGR